MKNSPFRYFKTSPEIIRLGVMMYIRYPLSAIRYPLSAFVASGRRHPFRTRHRHQHETVRCWWNRFGPLFAAKIRKRRIKGRNYSNWRWHLDEIFVRINGERHHLWLAVDHEGEVLEGYVAKRRDRRAALKLLKRTMKRHGAPWSIVTDRLRSYRAAMIAEDSCRVRTTLASRSPSRSIAPPMVERACARTRQKDRRGRGHRRRGLYPEKIPNKFIQPSKNKQHSSIQQAAW